VPQQQKSQKEASAIDEAMARQLEERRKQRPERRQRTAPVERERRALCQYCFQPGDHRTPAQCLRALGG
jgi:hypothetical protein